MGRYTTKIIVFVQQAFRLMMYNCIINHHKRDIMNQIIVNLTPYPSTPDQKDAGVFDLEGEALDILKEALKVTENSSAIEIYTAIMQISTIALTALIQRSYDTTRWWAMIDSQPFLQDKLENNFDNLGINLIYGCQSGESIIEETLPDQRFPD